MEKWYKNRLIPGTHLYAVEGTNNMHGRLLITARGRGQGVLRQLDHTARHSLQLANILPALADDATHLVDGWIKDTFWVKDE